MKYLLGVTLFTLFVSSCSTVGSQSRRERLRKFIEQRKLRDSNTTSKPYIHKKETKIYKSLSGVDPKRLSLDIYYKDLKSTNIPVLVWVHGGSFHTGDKAQGVEDLRDFALENNWIFVGVNYRLSPRPKFIISRMNKDRIKYPVHNNDIADALKWISRNIKNYGGTSSNLALIGHSAGAHLVSLMGTNKKFLKSKGIDFSNLKAVVSVDIDTYKVRPFVEKGIPMMVNAFGDSPVLNREASPELQLVKGENYPKFLVYTRGRDGRKKRIASFVNRLKEVNADVQVVDGSLYGHVGIAKALGVEKDMTAPLRVFLKNCFSR